MRRRDSMTPSSAVTGSHCAPETTPLPANPPRLTPLPRPLLALTDEVIE